MKKSLPIYATLAVYLTEVTGLCNLYLFFANTRVGTGAYVELWPWLLLSLATFLGMTLFLRQPRPLTHVVAFGVVSFVITFGVMGTRFVYASGVSPWVFAGLFFAITTGRGCFIPLERGCDVGMVILHCELPAVGIGIMLLVDAASDFYLPPYFIICAVALLILNLLFMTVARLYGDGGGEGKDGAALGAILLCFGGLGAVAVMAMKFATATMSATVSHTSTALMGVLGYLYRGMVAFFTWLASFAGEMESDVVELAPVEAAVVEETAMLSEVEYSIYPFVIALGVLLLCGALILIFKFRKVKLGKTEKPITYKRPLQRVEKISLLARFKAFLRGKYDAVKFAIAIRWKRHTPQGAVLLMAHIGKKRGVEKGCGESYASYLARLQALCPPEEGGREHMATLATILERTLYSPQGVQEKLSPKTYRAMRRAVAHIPHIKK